MTNTKIQTAGIVRVIGISENESITDLVRKMLSEWVVRWITVNRLFGFILFSK